MPDTLPDHLMTAVYRHRQECAWPRAEAVEVVNHLARRGQAVLGAEVWLPSPTGPVIPMPNLYHWSAPESDGDESPAAFTESARAACVRFIVDFDWEPTDEAYRGETPFFNLTFREDP